MFQVESNDIMAQRIKRIVNRFGRVAELCHRTPSLPPYRRFAASAGPCAKGDERALFASMYDDYLLALREFEKVQIESAIGRQMVASMYYTIEDRLERAADALGYRGLLADPIKGDTGAPTPVVDCGALGGIDGVARQSWRRKE